MGWLDWLKRDRSTDEPMKPPVLMTREHNVEWVSLSPSEFKELKEKAKAYDKLTSGQTGAFLRRNGIIN